MIFRSIPSALTIIIVVLIMAACSPIVRMLYGIKKPRVESETSLRKYLDKTDIETDNVYTLGFADYQRTLKLIDNKLPEVLIFDAEGRYIPYGDEWACNAGAFDFIEELNDSTAYRVSTKLHRDSIAPGLRTFAGDTPPSPPTDATYHVYIFWAKFAGKLNKNHVWIWEQQALENNNTSISVYKVNMDFQEHWGPEVTEKMEQ